MINPINDIIHVDVIEGFKLVSDETVSLIFTSPPYNVDIKYANRKDNEPWQNYLSWLEAIFQQAYRVLRKGGRLVINIDSIVNHEEDKNKEYFRPIYADLVNIGRKVGFNFRTDICWYKHQVVGRATAWGSYCSNSNPIIRRNHEYLLVWSKESWNLPGDSEFSDLTPEEFEQWTMSFWHIQPETRSIGSHPASFPEELAKRVIKLFSYRGDIVLDPFMGSGTTAFISKLLGRRYIGFDNAECYVKVAKERLNNICDIFQEDYIPRSVRLAQRKSEKNNENLTEQDIFK